MHLYLHDVQSYSFDLANAWRSSERKCSERFFEVHWKTVLPGDSIMRAPQMHVEIHSAEGNGCLMASK